MGWATHAIAKLKEGEEVTIRPSGHSMTPRVKSGQLCRIAPVEASKLAVHDIVLCRVRGNEYLHLVKAIQGSRYQIGNNRGRINGWVEKRSIFGKLVEIVEDETVT